MGTETATPGRAVHLNDGRTLYVRQPRAEDAAGIRALDGATLAYVARGKHDAGLDMPHRGTMAGERSEPVLVVALENGPLAAAAWLRESDDDPSLGNFSVAIQPAFRHAGLAPVLLGELAGQAALRGMTRMRSCVGQGAGDPLNDCHCAGLPILSALSFGGVTEVVLGARGVCEAAMA